MRLTHGGRIKTPFTVRMFETPVFEPDANLSICLWKTHIHIWHFHFVDCKKISAFLHFNSILTWTSPKTWDQMAKQKRHHFTRSFCVIGSKLILLLHSDEHKTEKLRLTLIVMCTGKVWHRCNCQTNCVKLHALMHLHFVPMCWWNWPNVAKRCIDACNTFPHCAMIIKLCK